MEYRRLGRTDLKVSVICLGTMTWGEQNTEAEGHAQMDYAVEQGVNFFDTAELYAIPPKPETQGSTERIIGSWFKARKNRDKIILASKVCGRGGNTWFRDDQSPTRLTRKQIMEAVDKSLQRLQTDYIDLYQIHFPERPMPWGSNPTRFSHAAYEKPADETSIPEQLDAFAEAVTAFAAGHRPCMECRRRDALAYRDALVQGLGLARTPRFPEIDRILDGERRSDREKRTHRLPATKLPDGAMLLSEQGDAFLALRGDTALLWSPSGYAGRRARPSGLVTVLTPPATLAALAHGYRPLWHPSAEALEPSAARGG